jgi:NADH-quinone oxidoreductase subunit F
MSRNLRALSARLADKTTLFEALTEAAGKPRGLTDEVIRDIADERLISPAVVLGTGSFYDFLIGDNRNKKAFLCKGTACLMSEERELVHAKLASHFSTNQIGELACAGRCYRGGGFQIDDRTFDAGSVEDFQRVGETNQNPIDQIPFFPLASASVLGEEVADPDSFYQRIPRAPETIIGELQASALRGRGGAGFPFAMKLKACASMPGETKYIVCNADEGDPGAFSDRYLLEQQPHRVLGGMLAAGLACGAHSAFIYVRAEYPEALACIAEAVTTFEASAVHAQTGFRFRIVRGAGSYVCGEETALLNSIEGLRPEVRVRPPYPAQEGLFGKPTLLDNVETFAAIPWILQQGGAAFAAIGTGRSTGTKLISLDHSFNRPGLYEIDMGMPLDRLVYKLAGGFRTEVKALQVGGPLGGVLPIGKIPELTLDFESFQEAGFLFGHASIVAIPRHYSMLAFMAHLFEFMAEESCGKCVPCRMGTRKGFEMLTSASVEQPLDRVVFDELLETLQLGSLCALGGGLPLPIRNILDYFGDELTDYFSAGGNG